MHVMSCIIILTKQTLSHKNYWMNSSQSSNIQMSFTRSVSSSCRCSWECIEMAFGFLTCSFGLHGLACHHFCILASGINFCILTLCVFMTSKSSSVSFPNNVLFSSFINFRVENMRSSLPLDTERVKRRRARERMLFHSGAHGAWNNLHHSAW